MENKKIYLGIMIALIAVVAVIAVFMLPQEEYKPHNRPPLENKYEELISKCQESGGTVETASCCKSVEDFPNTCNIGACGCSPDNSHEVKVCNCGERKCWTGTECATKCTSEDREAEACLALYEPVCGEPVHETYSNDCVACKDPEIMYYTEGECTNDQK